MKKVFFTPGPAELYFTYQDHLKVALSRHLGSISHRSSEFQELFSFSVDQISTLLNLPEGYRIVFTTSATECWERITQNLISDNSTHFVHGDFGEKFFKVSEAFGRSATLTRIDQKFIPEKVDAQLIGLTMNETSTGFQLTNDHLKEMRSLNPDALIALDVVSASPSIEVDFGLVDTAYFSVQKCFGMPPGLGVWIVNDRAIQKAKELDHPSYHSLPNLLKNADKNQNPCTPNVLAIYLIGKIAEDLNRRGTGALRSETNYKAALLYQTLDAHPLFELAVSEKVHRSKTVAVANVKDDHKKVLDFFKEKGMIVGNGYGDQKGRQIRIANFPTHSKEQVEMLCDALQKLT